MRREPTDEALSLAVVDAYVTKEESIKSIARQLRASQDRVRAILQRQGVRIRPKHEQRALDQRHGRYDHAAACRRAWQEGRYDTPTFNGPRKPYNRDSHGEKNSFFGRTHTPEARAAIREKSRKRAVPGSGEYGDAFNDKLKLRILLRDRFKCQVCGRSDRVLQVHHVDCNRSNDQQSNLLTLCAPCHLGFHGRRENADKIRLAHELLLLRLRAEHRGSDC